VEIVAQLGRRAVALVGVAGQGAQHDRVELGRHRLVERRRRDQLRLLHVQERLVLVLRREQRSRGQELMGDDADREQIGAGVELLAGDRLRRHVGQLALDPAGLGAELLRLRLGDAEVDDLQVARAGDHQVRRRDVAVDQSQGLAVVVALGVGVLEGLAGLDEQRQRDVDRRRPRHLAGLAQDAPDVAAVDVLHRDEVDAADLAQLEELDDVGVVEHERELGLAHEGLDEGRVLGQVRQEALERHHALDALDAALLGAVDRRHPADAEALEDGVRAELLLRERARGLLRVEGERHDAGRRDDLVTAANRLREEKPEKLGRGSARSAGSPTANVVGCG
jgi:hypothetical protein